MKRKILKVIITAIIIVIAFVIQSYISLSTNQTVATPNLLLLVTCMFGFMRGKNYGILTGLFCGLLVDIMYGDLIGLYMLIYLYIGFFSGLFKNLLHDDHVFMPMLLVFGNDFVYNILIFVFRFLLRNKLSFSYYFEKIIFPEMIFTAFIMLILYKPLYKLNDKFFVEKQESELNFVK